MAETVCRLEIKGRVQGVGFRWAMVEEARRSGVCGWVRNRRDGSVEALLAGSPEAVGRLIDWARRGPRFAAVADVEVFDSEGEFDSFEQLPTL